MSLDGAVSLLDNTIDLDGLLSAYLERKKFESRMLWAMLGEALNKKERNQMGLGMLSMMGFGIRGA